MFPLSRKLSVAFTPLLLLSTIALFSLGACASQTVGTSQAGNSEQTNEVEEAAADQEDTFPQRLLYDGEYYTVESIDFYQDYSDYEYYLYAVVKIDLSEMSEAGQHWLLEKGLTGYILQTDVSIADKFSYTVDGEKLNSANRYVDGSTVYYLFYSDKTRDSCEGQEYKLYVTNRDYDRQLETSDPKYQETYSIIYGTVPSGLSVPETMPDDVYQAFSENLSSIADAIASN